MRKMFWAALAAFFALGTALSFYVSYQNSRIAIRLTADQAEEAIAFAFERSKLKSKMTLSDINVLFEEGVVVFTARVAVTRFNINASANIRAKGTLKYRRSALYFITEERPDISELSFKSVSTKPKWFPGLRERIRELAEDTGLKELSDAVKEQLKIKIVTPAVEILFNEVLKKNPVLRLKNDTKGAVLRAILEDVRIVDNVFVATLFLGKVTNISFLGMILLLCAVGTAVFARIRGVGTGMRS